MKKIIIEIIVKNENITDKMAEDLMINGTDYTDLEIWSKSFDIVDIK